MAERWRQWLLSEDPVDAVEIGVVQLEGRRGRPPTATSAYDHFRQIVYLPFVNFVLLDLQERFLAAAASCFKVCKLLPRSISDKDANEEDFDDLVDLYQNVLPDECQVWRDMWRFPPYNEIPKFFADALKVCHKSTMPVVYTLCQIGATFQVTVYTAERSFFSMKLLKNYLRSYMKEDR